MFANATYHYSSQKPFDKYTPDVYVPPFLFLQFLCIMGWIKVAEKLLNPFGDDHEDIKVKEIIDRNIQVGGSTENEDTLSEGYQFFPPGDIPSTPPQRLPWRTNWFLKKRF